MGEALNDNQLNKIGFVSLAIDDWFMIDDN